MAGTQRLDLVLITLPSRPQAYQSLGRTLAAVENPVWARLMATLHSTQGLSVAIIDAGAEELLPPVGLGARGSFTQADNEPIAPPGASFRPLSPYSKFTGEPGRGPWP
jgi:hypothetical protein